MPRTLLSLMTVLLFLSGKSMAEPANPSGGLPKFTLAEEIIIARNDALGELAKVDPGSVRKILDAIIAARQKQSEAAPGDRPRDVTGRQPPAGGVTIDPSRNPDLDYFQRASPEAAYDLFQLLKRAGDKRSN